MTMQLTLAQKRVLGKLNLDFHNWFNNKSRPIHKLLLMKLVIKHYQNCYRNKLINGKWKSNLRETYSLYRLTSLGEQVKNEITKSSKENYEKEKTFSK